MPIEQALDPSTYLGSADMLIDRALHPIARFGHEVVIATTYVSAL
jgi:hypothetical protein